MSDVAWTGRNPPPVRDSGTAVVWARSKADGGLVFCSPEFFTWTGTTVEELARDRDCWMRAVHQDDRRVIEQASDALARQAVVWRLNRPDGELRWIRTRVLDVEGAENLAFWLGLAEDVTDEVAGAWLRSRTEAAEDALRGLLADPAPRELDAVAAASEAIVSEALGAPVKVRLGDDPAATGGVPVHGPDGDLLAGIVGEHLTEPHRVALGRLAPVLGHVLSTARLHLAGGQASRVIETLLAGESVIGAVAATLADSSPADLDPAITASLARLGELVRADRAYLFRYRDDGRRLDNTHEWCAAGIDPVIDMLQDLDPAEFAWTESLLAEGRAVFVDVAGLGPEAAAERDILQAQDIKTLALVPMIARGRLIGFVGFDAVRAARSWGEYEGSLLTWFVRLLQIALSRAELEASLTAARDAAERASAAKSDFIFKSSHELRTPLNAVQGFAFLTRRAHDDVERERYLDRLEEGVGALASIVEDLLMLGRAETGSHTSAPGPVRLCPLVDAVAALLEPQAAAARVGLTVDLPDVAVAGDADTFEHVFRNLLDNAIKYNRPGGRVTVTARAAEDTVSVEVADTGLGIPAHRLAQVWEPFERGGAETSTATGSGLGLPIVRALVERVGGSVTVQSVEGRGSAFAVDLPLWAGGRADPTTAGPAAPGGAVALVAAESADGRDLLAGVLRHAGFDRVERAAGLAEAERALRDLRPALAVLESDLGDGYASDVLRGLERRGHRLPVIVVTDLPDPDDERRLQEAGAWAVLATPLDVPRLAALAEQARAVQSAG